MVNNIQKKKAEVFYQLHHSENILLVPNAWDVISAKIFEIQGFKTIGTASSAFSNSRGFPDGENITLEDNLWLIREICKRTDLPVTADIEAGYTNNLEILKVHMEKVINTGVVGINIEDSPGFEGQPLLDIEFQKEKINVIRSVALDMGIHLFINARIDTFLFMEGTLREKLDETFRRAEAFMEAGADSIFVPDMGIINEELVKILCSNIKAPLNLLAGKEKPPVKKLTEIGVKRISFGPRFFRALLSNLREISKEILEEGKFDKVTASNITAKEINGWFK